MKHFKEDEIYNVLNGEGFSISQDHNIVSIELDYHVLSFTKKEAIEMFQEAIDWLKTKEE